MLGIWFGLQLVNGLAMDVAGGGVAYWAHAGGFVAGVVLMLPVFLRRGGPAYWAATHGKPPHEEVEYVVAKSRRSPVPSVRRVRSPRDTDRPLADLSRVPRSGHRRGPRTRLVGRAGLIRRARRCRTPTNRASGESRSEVSGCGKILTKP
jgi:hypothetical protein